MGAPGTFNRFISAVRYLSDIKRVIEIPRQGREALQDVTAQFPFRATDYYLSNINWADPADPLRQLIIPRREELDPWGDLDACNEAGVTVLPGVQHKYADTVLVLASRVCGGLCRYCFRKRLFMAGNHEVTADLSAAVDYIAEHPEVTNVLLTGGDPLLLSTRRLVEIFSAIRAIPHVQIIRMGSKIPAFNPFRIINDADLLAAFRKFSEPRRRIYLMAHFDHPRELTDEAVQAIDLCTSNGVICVNQCPLIAGINDDAEVLSGFYRQLSFIGCPPYYLFQCRPTAGNKPYSVPIVRGWNIFREALRRGSGLACRPRYVMSHESGKIEILAVDDQHIHMRYHRAKDPAQRGRLITCHRNDQACWFDELAPLPERHQQAIQDSPAGGTDTAGDIQCQTCGA